MSPFPTRFALLGAAVALAGAVVAISPPASSPACACSCVETDAADQFDAADAVFTGVLIEREEPAWQRPDGPVVLVFQVEKVHKGVAFERQGVATAASDASCGLAVEVGTGYTVFAGHDDSGLAADLCGGTRPADDRAELDVAPEAELHVGADGIPQRRPLWLPIAVAGTVGVLLGALGPTVWRRLRGRRRAATSAE